MWPFKNKPKHPPAAFNEKQLELLNLIDSKLVDMHKGKRMEGQMKVKSTSVPFMSTVLTTRQIYHGISLESGEFYLPQGVALLVDTYGNWVFIYAVRAVEGSDPLMCDMFLDLLTRTNNARNQK